MRLSSWFATCVPHKRPRSSSQLRWRTAALTRPTWIRRCTRFLATACSGSCFVDFCTEAGCVVAQVPDSKSNVELLPPSCTSQGSGRPHRFPRRAP
eukprot:5166709-Alexandrium_andersonii.AAC.1